MTLIVNKTNLFSTSGAKFAFDIYDFEGKCRVDMFYLADCLRGLNVNPTLKMIQKLGGATKKGEKFMKLEEFYPIYGMSAKMTFLNFLLFPIIYS